MVSAGVPFFGFSVMVARILVLSAEKRFGIVLIYITDCLR